MNDVGSKTLEECLFPGCDSNAVHPKDVPAYRGSMLGFCEPFNSSYADFCLALDLCQALLLLRCSKASIPVWPCKHLVYMRIQDNRIPTSQC